MRELKLGERVVFINEIGKGPQRTWCITQISRLVNHEGEIVRYGCSDKSECHIHKASIATLEEAKEIARILDVELVIAKEPTHEG